MLDVFRRSHLVGKPKRKRELKVVFCLFILSLGLPDQSGSIILVKWPKMVSTTTVCTSLTPLSLLFLWITFIMCLKINSRLGSSERFCSTSQSATPSVVFTCEISSIRSSSLCEIFLLVVKSSLKHKVKVWNIWNTGKHDWIDIKRTRSPWSRIGKQDNDQD